MTELLRLSGRVSALADGFTVRRVLSAAGRRSVGPFVFFDHFGPVTLKPETDSDVGAHPHIGLATVSYLFEGNLVHRDRVGTVQTITPGAINWMG
jgi:redox-sensitive bicupin YhaK (pirin superfamily)